MAHGREAPEADEDDEALLDADAVDDAPGKHHPDRVGELEAEHDAGVGPLIPGELLLQGPLEQADDLAVDVVDGRREEQQRADDPALVADFSECSGHGEGFAQGKGS